jgi:hypothetical protein
MRWLLNMNMPRSLKQLLESVGHQCRHTGEIGLERAGDGYQIGASRYELKPTA